MDTKSAKLILSLLFIVIRSNGAKRRSCAVSFTDFWEAYQNVFPSTRHRAAGKETDETAHIERLNNTFRQRIARLVRKTLSFSKKLQTKLLSGVLAASKMLTL